MGFGDIINFCKAKAIGDALEPTEDSVYRGLCREYSERFSVPLPEVYLLDPEHVLTEAFASQLERLKDGVEENLEYILDQIYTLEDPDYVRQKKEELENFIKLAEEEEELRLEEGRPIHKALKGLKNSMLEASIPSPEIKPTPPKKGSVDFTKLNNKNET